MVLGGQDRIPLQLADYASYYRAAKRRFIQALEAKPTHPEPVPHCSLCRWEDTCKTQWQQEDALCLVARLNAEQARKLTERASISTSAALAGAPDDLNVKGIGHGTLGRLQRQARLQIEHRPKPPGTPPPYEFIETEGPDIGLAALPEPSPGDLFFDIEGDPFVSNEGLEYLLGVGWTKKGEFCFKAFWGHTPSEEKRAFEDFIDSVVQRRKNHPDLYIFHYASYERTALGKLMGRYATREEEVDDLMRSGVLVDLYRVIRQGLLVGTESLLAKENRGSLPFAPAGRDYLGRIQHRRIRALATNRGSENPG